MLKRKIDHYIKRYYETTRNALLITGARQIGKTYSIRQFGKSFKSFVEINFIDNPEAVDVFKGAKGSADILFRLSAMTTIPLIKGETLIFFDEVQKCPEMVTAIKFLVDEGSYRYILSGIIAWCRAEGFAFGTCGIYGNQRYVSPRFRGVYFVCGH